MPPDVAVSDLLLEWEERAAAGRPATPEELCRSRPELLGELRRCVALLRFVSPLLDLGGAAGPTVPGFEVLNLLGGGMGVVYRARDVALERVVALKMPHPGVLTGRVARSRFEREARVLAQLRHPNIVPVHAAGLAGGRPYFVMDYVPQGSLAGQAPQLTGQAEAVAEVIEKVARAVQYAHEQGVLHRDLKPSNILIDEHGQPLVADFGVAALLDPGREEAEPDTPADGDTEGARPAPRLTGTGATVGTPAYMAPELFAAGGRASPAADVWSLGVILYELLTGRRPFAAADPARLGDVIRGADPPRPSAARPALRHDRRLDAIVLRCLAKSPGDRYASAGALADDLARWRGAPRSRRRRSRVLGLAFALAAALGLAFFLSRPVDEEARHRKLTQASVGALERQEPVDLIGATGPPVSFVVRAGKAATHVVPNGDGTFSISTDRLAMIELLPEVGAVSYRISAEVREDAYRTDSADLGIYWGAYQPIETTRGPAQLFGYLRFADLGPESRASLDHQRGNGSRFALTWLYYREPGPSLARRITRTGPSQWYQAPPQESGRPGPWRQLSIEVTPERVQGHMDEVRLAAMPHAPLAGWVSILRQLAPELPEIPGEPPRGGGLGLYVNGCKASVRNYRVVPLVNP